MYHVLLPFDGSAHSENALQHVIAMKQHCGSLKVTLVCIAELPYMHGDAVTVSMTDNIGHNLIDNARRTLAGAQERLEAAGVEVDTYVEADDPARAIAEQAETRQCDAIVMGTRGLGRISELVLGSVAYKTVHLTKIPVTLVQ
ncbi:MAG: universal stress protein [Nevskiales bacterium]|nr:universal stress protein [Nevskiales bacterium]